MDKNCCILVGMLVTLDPSVIAIPDNLRLPDTADFVDIADTIDTSWILSGKRTTVALLLSIERKGQIPRDHFSRNFPVAKATGKLAISC